eukprot:1379950-Prymnesium_polylepis.1
MDSWLSACETGKARSPERSDSSPCSIDTTFQNLMVPAKKGDATGWKVTGANGESFSECPLGGSNRRCGRAAHVGVTSRSLKPLPDRFCQWRSCSGRRSRTRRTRRCRRARSSGARRSSITCTTTTG